MTQPDSASAPVPPFLRDPAPMLARIRGQWAGHQAGGGRHADLWIFGYASLIWRPDFESTERHATRVHGWHRALKMWSRINRGTPERPGLVFALLPGGSCQGMVYRVPHREADAALAALWAREMPTGVYDPRWLPCPTPHGPVPALAFTLSRRSPNYTGDLHPQQVARDLPRRPWALRHDAGLCAPDLRRAAPAWHPRPQACPPAGPGRRLKPPRARPRQGPAYTDGMNIADLRKSYEKAELSEDALARRPAAAVRPVAERGHRLRSARAQRHDRGHRGQRPAPQHARGADQGL
jgi:cation transport protein ChaC